MQVINLFQFFHDKKLEKKKFNLYASLSNSRRRLKADFCIFCNKTYNYVSIILETNKKNVWDLYYSAVQYHLLQIWTNMTELWFKVFPNSSLLKY